MLWWYTFIEAGCRRLPVLCLLLACSGGALGADIRSMILTPGPLAQVHAEEEGHCESCHQSFDKTAQDELCMNCHEEVAADRSAQTGHHGLSEAIRGVACRSCHSDHKGRDFNILSLDPDTFAHALTDFPLEGRHASVACDSCHVDGDRHRDAGPACADCHESDDAHRGELGADCGSCHAPGGWGLEAGFDHGATRFPLDGGHRKLNCGACHAGERYRFEDHSCVGCHNLQDVHLGRNGDDCAHCHSTAGWSEHAFDHGRETGFSLSGAHAETPCQACHFDDEPGGKPSSACVGCHRSEDVHAGRHGEDCAECHSDRTWQQVTFDHARDAGWALSGKHAELICLQCHTGNLSDPVDGRCVACHHTDDVHHSERLEDCDLCHQTTGWEGTANFDHELTHFPLEGLHALVSCADCHASHEFNTASSACADCHGVDDDHRGSMGAECHQCHTPNGWGLWRYDHATATGFSLTGAHAALSCNSCHRGESASEVAHECSGCHTRDDRHQGRFGGNCERCHNTETFGGVEWQR